MPAVVIAAQRAWLVPVEIVCHVSHPFLAFPRLAEIIVQISHPVARLVSVPVATDPAPDVVGSRDIIWKFHGKERIQPGFVQFPADPVNVVLNIVRNIPGVLEGESFGDVSPPVHRTRPLVGYRRERRPPFPFAVAPSHISGFRVNEVAV